MAGLVPDEPVIAAPPESAAGSARRQWPSTAELAVVIPVLNECDNVALMVERLTRALAGIRWEAIFVDDDSPDGTADVVRALARLQSNIRCVQRLGRRGLAIGDDGVRGQIVDDCGDTHKPGDPDLSCH